MTEAKKLVLKYWSIIAQLPVEFLEASFDSSDWMKDRAIKCAIAETEAVIEAIDNADTIALNFGHDYRQELVNKQNIWIELTQMQ